MNDTVFWVALAAFGVSIVGTFAYLAFMIFLPEWVGITGKVAIDAEKSHEGGQETESAFWAKLGQVPVKPATEKDSNSDTQSSEKKDRSS